MHSQSVLNYCTDAAQLTWRGYEAPHSVPVLQAALPVAFLVQLEHVLQERVFLSRLARKVNPVRLRDVPVPRTSVIRSDRPVRHDRQDAQPHQEQQVRERHRPQGDSPKASEVRRGFCG